MPDPWNIVSSSKDEPNVSEIVTAELCNRLLVEEGFVWVDIPEERVVEETTTSINISDLETVNTFQLYSATDAKVAQQFSDDENDDVINIFDEDWVDPNSWEHFKHKKKPKNCHKVKYPTPQWLKRFEHGTVKINKEKGTSDGNRNSLLPNMKFYPSTVAVLEKLIKDRYLGKYNGLVGTGKNSVVFHAECHRRVSMAMPRFNAVKVYKISNDVERNKIIFKRVQREYEHLKIVNKYVLVNGVYKHYAPEPVRARENVIIMQFFGYINASFVSIEDHPSNADNHMYNEIVEFMDRCYKVMHLVHGKLGAKKILCWMDCPLFIGWSPSVKTDHPMALSKLIRDCHFVTEFYRKRGVKVKSTVDLFKDITGVCKISNKLMKIINKTDLYDKYDSNPNRKIMDANGKCRFK